MVPVAFFDVAMSCGGWHIETMIAPKFDFSHLSGPERLQLVEELWDSLTPDQVPLSPSQMDEVVRREALHDAAPERGRDWRLVLDEIESKRV